ncbi:MAG: redoxin domain-containing protein [Saprospiraceae bacterium]|nr:redoxin domain-containing protein [Saprospiraceae bacterium]
MRILVFLIPIVFCCCSASPTNESAVDSNTDTIEQTAPPTKSPNGSANTPDFTGYKIGDPVMGGPADIEVKVNGLPAGDYRLIGFYAEGHFLADSVKANANGVIRIRDKEGYPQGLYYLTLTNNQLMQLVLGEDQKFKIQANLADLNNSVQVEGSKENELYYASMKFEADFSQRHREITSKIQGLQQGSAERNALNKEKTDLEKSRLDYLDNMFSKYPDLLFVKFKMAGQNPIVRNDVPESEKVYYFRKEFWDNVDFSDRRLIRTPVILNKLKRYMTELTAQNQDSVFSSAKMLVDKAVPYPEYFKFFANWIVIKFEPSKTTLMDPESVFVNMVNNYFTKELAFWSDSMEVYGIQRRAYEMGQSLLGLKGPNVISTDQFGNKQELYKKTADYLIVYMYNPTCEHCMEQTPQLVEWYNKNKNRDIDVYAIAIDTNEEEWKNYIKKTKMNFTNVFDATNRSIYAKYYVDVTPEIYVLNKDRTIIGKNLKVNQIDIILDRDRAKNQ